MPTIRLETLISANPAKCFDLSRDLDLHSASMAHTAERAIAGRTEGLIEYGEEVTWEARHFGLMHTHTSKITAFERPSHFRDEMTKGRFRTFVHDHFFEPDGAGTRMIDVLDFEAPLGILGTIANSLFLTRYLHRLLERRNEDIKHAAEASS